MLTLWLKIALPFALFLAAAQAPPSVLLNIDYLLALAVGLIATYVIGFILVSLFFATLKRCGYASIIGVFFLIWPTVGHLYYLQLSGHQA